MIIVGTRKLYEITTVTKVHVRFQMVELQSVKDCDFTLTNSDTFEDKQTCKISEIDEDEDCQEISNELKTCKQQLISFLSIIKEQREVLRECIKRLKMYSKG